MRRPLDFDVRSYFHPLHPVLELLPVEVDVAQVEDAAQDLEDGLALLKGETEDLQWGRLLSDTSNVWSYTVLHVNVYRFPIIGETH